MCLGITVGQMLPRSTIDPSLLGAWTDVIENITDAVFVIAGTASAGPIVHVNSQVTRMFGYERCEIVNQSIEVLVPQHMRQRLMERRRLSAENPNPRRLGESPNLLGRRRDGTEFPIDVLLTPEEQSGAPVTMLIVRDMTDRERLVDLLTRARDSALQASEVKSRFAAAAGRDLRQSLQTIWGIHSILAQTFKNTDYAPHVALLEEGLRNMDQRLSALTEITRLETSVPEELIPVPIPVPILAPRAGGAIKVLHIEDDPSVARSMARVLRLEGYEVASAATRDEAMQHLEIHGLRPDLILTDSQLRMGFTSDQIVAEIAARLQFRPPTIMLTGAANQQGEHARSFADRILAKPVDIKVLLREIERLLSSHPSE
jgi:PAS domain S-box-containing protein